jgi:biopolymer transport protein TolR
MGMNVSTGSRKGRRSYSAKAEMNLTPLIDVMCVLLIIFMISAPLMTATVPIDLPQIGKGPASDGEDPLVISIDKNNDVYIQDQKIKIEELVPRLQAISTQKEQRLYIRGDQALSYGKIMEIMSQLTAAGFTKVGLVADTAS